MAGGRIYAQVSPPATNINHRSWYLGYGRRPWLGIGVAAGDHWETDVVWLINGRRPYLCIGVAAGDRWERNVVWLIDGRRPYLCIGVAACDYGAFEIPENQSQSFSV